MTISRVSGRIALTMIRLVVLGLAIIGLAVSCAPVVHGAEPRVPGALELAPTEATPETSGTAAEANAPAAATTATATTTTTATKTETAEPTAHRARDRFVIVAGGDVMFGRYRSHVYRASGGDAPFAYVSPLFQDADMAFVNLETPLMDDMPERFQRGDWDNHDLAFRAPTRYAQVLADAGIDVVSLANNHAEDCRAAGIASTIAALDQAGVKHVGTSVAGDAYAPLVLDYDGTQVVVLALALHRNLGELGKGERPPVAYLPRKLAASWVPERVAALRAEYPDALIAFSVHWGVEYENEPYTGLRTLAHGAIDAGADIVLGHHPHVLQPVESYGGGLILYSMGNLIFDMNAERSQRSALFRIEMQRDDAGRWRAHTLLIEPVRVRPTTGARQADRTMAGAILRDLRDWSRHYRHKTQLVLRGSSLVWQAEKP